MRGVIKFTFLGFVLTVGVGAWAQLDPSTALLLRRPSAEPPIDTLDEDHYTTRSIRRAPHPAPAIVITPAPSADGPAPASAARAPRFEPAREPAGETAPTLEFDRDTLLVRVNAGYFNADAQSGRTLRDTTAGGATVGMGITLWATPTFGFKIDYLSSVAAHARRDQRNFGVDHQEIDAALVHRLTWGSTAVDLLGGYHQINNHVTRGSGSPRGTESRGPDVGVGLTRPRGSSYAHTGELHLQPYLGHTEFGPRPTTDSGSASASFGASVAVGGRYGIDHDRDLYWRAKYSFEQNMFSQGPGVSTNQVMLILGVQWGT